MNNIPGQQRDLRPQISVTFITYNASWERVRATLNSVILQKGINFELIISDDGSQDNHSDKIKDFLARHSFTNYTFIAHKENQGTVKNHLDAVLHSKADYVKGIGQGDLFSDEYALRDVYEDFITTGAVMGGAGYVSFHLIDSQMKLCRTPRMPQDLEVFRTGSIEQQKKAMLIDRDYLHGPTMIFKRDVFAKYLKIMAEAGIKYTDDVACWLMVADDLRMSYFNRLSVFYEADVGFSNYASNIMQKDHDVMIDLIIERIKDRQPELSLKLKEMNSLYRKHRAMYEKIRKSLGIFFFFFMIPHRIFRAARKFIKGDKTIYTSINAPTDFVNLCINRE